MTDNRKARRKVRKQKEAKIGRKFYVKVVRNITKRDVDFSRIYANLVKDEKSNSSQIEASLYIRILILHMLSTTLVAFYKKRTLHSRHKIRRSLLFWKI